MFHYNTNWKVKNLAAEWENEGKKWTRQEINEGIPFFI